MNGDVVGSSNACTSPSSGSSFQYFPAGFGGAAVYAEGVTVSCSVPAKYNGNLSHLVRMFVAVEAG
jgi:hypothetical protein